MNNPTPPNTPGRTSLPEPPKVPHFLNAHGLTIEELVAGSFHRLGPIPDRTLEKPRPVTLEAIDEKCSRMETNLQQLLQRLNFNSSPKKCAQCTEYEAVFDEVLEGLRKL